MLSSSHHWNRLWNLSLRISPARNLVSSLLDAGEICKVAIFSTSFHITYLTYTSCDSMQHLRDSIFFTVRLLTVFFSQDVKIMSCKNWKYGSRSVHKLTKRKYVKVVLIIYHVHFDNEKKPIFIHHYVHISGYYKIVLSALLLLFSFFGGKIHVLRTCFGADLSKLSNFKRFVFLNIIINC